MEDRNKAFVSGLISAALTFLFITILLFILFSATGCSTTIGNIKSWVRSIDNEPLPPTVEALRNVEFYNKNSSGARILAGFAKVNITPYDSQYLAGYYPTRKSNGVHDELWAKCLALEGSNGGRIVIVSTDLVGLLPNDVRDIRDLVGEIAYSTNILITSSHTHSAPDTIGLWGQGLFGLSFFDGKDSDYLKRIKKDIATGIREAINTLRVAKISFGKVETSGLVKGRINNYPDETLNTIFVNFGSATVTLVNFGIHPALIYGRLVTSDLVYFLRENLECLTGGEVMFVNGALGGVNPNVDADGWHEARVVGEELACLAYKCLRFNMFAPSSTVIIDQKEFIYPPLENNNFILANKLGMIPDLRDKNGCVSVELNYIQIGEVIILTVPGELFPSVWQKIKDGLGKYKVAMLFGLTNGELGYILSKKDYLSGDHPYHVSVSVGSEIGERIEKAFEEMIK